MALKTNLLGGTATLGAFIGIGKGFKKPAAVQAPLAGIVVPVKPLAGVSETLEDDDEALDDTGEDGQDTPADGDDDEAKSKKRANRRARKAKRLEKEKAQGEGSDTEDDDDSDEEMRSNSALAQARLRERARCAAIFGCAGAEGNIELAAHYAFNTKMTRSEAIGALAVAPKAAKAGSSFDERMERENITIVPAGGPAAGPQAGTAEALVARIMKAGKPAKA